MWAGMVVGLSRIIGHGAGRLFRTSAIVVALGVAEATTAADIRLVDDAGHAIRLAAPARRIVSLAPGSTELLYAAGAGEYVVGTVEYSDEPPAARALPRVGNAMQIDVERIAALKPDLVVAWPHGAALRQAHQLRLLGIPLWTSDPRSMPALADAVVAFGRLAGTENVAAREASAFRALLDELQKRNAREPRIEVFIQIADRPLLTVNGAHLIANALTYCSARNIFTDAPSFVPEVSAESVIARRPRAIVLLGRKPETGNWRKRWEQTGSVQSTTALIEAPADGLSSFSLRAGTALQRLCGDLAYLRR